MKRNLSIYITLILISISISLTSCGKSEENEELNSNSTNLDNVEIVDDKDYSDLEKEINILLDSKSYITLSAVSLSTSPIDENKMKFDIKIVGDNIEDNIDDILQIFEPNKNSIDFDNSIIKSQTDEIIYPTNNQSSSQSQQLPTVNTNMEIPEGNLSDWNLILLNHDPDNKIDKELNFDQVKFDTQYVDARASEFYQKMYNDAKKDGITLYLRSGYRSISTQTVNYNANVERLQKEGLSKEEAIVQTNLYYTVPGHSEHHTGLAFDIITPEYHSDVYTLNEQFAETKAYKWLLKNCADYGFILRYQEHKTDITGINFEPWHYRYVGIEHAKYITENDICFEEYIELLKSNGR